MTGAPTKPPTLAKVRKYAAAIVLRRPGEPPGAIARRVLKVLCVDPIEPRGRLYLAAVAEVERLRRVGAVPTSVDAWATGPVDVESTVRVL